MRSEVAIEHPIPAKVMKMEIRLKRAYDAPETSEGPRFLVDRLWPRGAKKDALKLDGWLKEAAPSDELRRWFGHDPAKWQEFQSRYERELDGKPEAWQAILAAAREGKITLIYSAKDRQHNNAVALKAYLERRLKK